MNLPPNPFAPETQYHRLYEFIRAEGGITTRMIHRMGADTARVRCEIKKYLRQHERDIKTRTIPGDPGNRYYEVVELMEVNHAA